MTCTSPKIWPSVLCILMLAMATALSGCAAKTAARPDGSLVVKGKARHISLEKGILTVKPPEGEAVTVKLPPTTTYTNIRVEEIKRGQPLEVIYKVEGPENMAIAVRAIQEGSC
jgi:hypothetical protein